MAGIRSYQELINASAQQIYIHLRPNNVSRFYSKTIDALQSRDNNLTALGVPNKTAQVMGINQQYVKEYFSMLEDLRKNLGESLDKIDLRTIIQKEVDGQQVALRSSQALAGDLTSKVGELQGVLDNFELILNQSAFRNSSRIATEIMKQYSWSDFLKSQKIEPSAVLSSYEDFKKLQNQYISELKSKNYHGVKLDDLGRQGQANISEVIKIINMKSIFQGQVSSGLGHLTVKSDVFKSFIYALINRLQTTLGVLYEDLLVKKFNEEADKLLKNFVKGFKGSLQGSFQSVGTEKSGGYTNTSDINISNGNLTVRIPGISVKTTSYSSTQKTADLKVKSEANLTGLLEDAPPATKGFIYNLIALNNKHLKGSTVSFGNQAEELYSLLRRTLVMRGLIGTMTQSDFAYYFIVNGKIYTINKILNDLEGESNPDTTIFSVTNRNLKFTPGWTKIGAKNQIFKPNTGETIFDAALRRSDMLRSEIEQMKVDLWISYKLTHV